MINIHPAEIKEAEIINQINVIESSVGISKVIPTELYKSVFDLTNKYLDIIDDKQLSSYADFLTNLKRNFKLIFNFLIILIILKVMMIFFKKQVLLKILNIWMNY
jgi:hypothetical protein